MVQTPIVNARLKYINGLELSNDQANAKKLLQVAAGACANSDDTNDIILSSAITINAANLGVNGMDVLIPIALSTMYAVYVIGDSSGYNDAAGLVALASASAPNLPAGYDMYRRIGWALTNGVAAPNTAFLQFWQNGHGNTRNYLYDVNIATAVTAGNATTLTAIDLSVGVPPIECNVNLNLAFTASATSSRVEFGPYGQVNAVGPIKYGSGAAAAVAQDAMVLVPCRLNAGVPKVMYLVSAGGDAVAVNVAGFDDLLA